MRLAASLTALTAAALLAGCELETTGPQCRELITQPASTSGDTVTTVTGLRYIETKVGTGAEVRSCDAVLISYSGRLASNNEEFDQGRFAFVPGMGEVIPGFAQGVVGMRVGGIRRLIIPPALGYGAQPQVDQNGNIRIPGNSTLIFDVEVQQVASQ